MSATIQTVRESGGGIAVRYWHIALIILGMVFGSLLSGWYFSRGAVPRSSAQSDLKELVVPDDGFIFRAKDGRVVAKISSTPEGGGITIYNGDGNPYLAAYSDNGYGQFGVFGKDNGPSVLTSANENGGQISVFDRRFSKSGILISSGGGSNIMLDDAKGNMRINLNTDGESKDAGQLMIYDQEGKIRLRQP